MTATKDISLPQWQADRQKPNLRASASQLETFELCGRKWWLERVRKLKVGQSKPQTFGDALHGVIERFLLADDLGRDPKTGKAVDLFPEGWHITRSRFDKTQISGEISVAEQDQIKRMIPAAIESGVLERQPGRRIEWKFHDQVLEVHDQVVSLEGFIDAAYPHRVEDHKSTSSMRWAKTPDALRKSTQMMLYAKVVSEDAVKQGLPRPEKILLRHNVYCKDPNDPRVRKVEAVVTADEIEKYWKKILESLTQMADYRRRFDKWHEVPEPRDLSRACNAYGGCPYRPICAGVESEEGFQNRLDRIYGPGYSSPTAGVSAENKNIVPEPVTTKGSGMGFDFASKLAARKNINAAANAGSAPAPAAPSINPTTSAPATVPAAPKPPASAAPTGTEAPPWANPSCNACKGSGFNSKGTPCRICDVKAPAEKRPISGAFDIEYPGDGTAIWVGKSGTETDGQAGVSALPGGSTPVATEAKASVEAPKPEAKPEPVAAPKPSKAEAPKPEAKPEPKSENAEDENSENPKGGRPKKGFALLINCAVIKGEGRVNSGRNCYHLPEVFASVSAEVAAQNGVENFYSLDPFKRRDMIARNAEAIAEMFGADMLVCSQLSTSNPDIRAFFDAIRPYAGIEIVGGV